MTTIVIMPGGFHPFHAGHFSLYQAAKQKFPGAQIYVAATNDQSERPFPFSIKEKLATVAGVEPGHFVQVKSPFQAKEITSHYNPDQDVLIFVRSEKDRNESPKPGGIKKDGSPAYFQPYTGKNMQPFGKHGYMAYLPTIEFGPGITSATEIRNSWPRLNQRQKLTMVMSLYPKTQKNRKLADNVVKLLDMGMSNQVNETFDKNDFPRDFASKEYLSGQQRAKLLMRLVDLGYELSDLELLSSDELLGIFRDEYFKKLNEVTFFKMNKPKEIEQPQEPQEVQPDDYHLYFAKPTLPPAKEKQYHGWDEYNQEKSNTNDVEEARIHQPKFVNLYVLHPKDPNIRKKINVDIPFDRLDRYVKELLKKYPNLSVQQLVYKAADSEPDKYGRVIEENPDYLEEK